MKGLVSLFTFLSYVFLTIFYQEQPVPFSYNIEGEIEYSNDAWKTPFTHHYITINHTLHNHPTNVTFHYVCAGDPSVEKGRGGDKNVVFLHGFPDSWAVWRHAMGMVAREGFYAIALDMKGFGQSSKPLSSQLYPDEVEGNGLGGNYTFTFAGEEIVAALDAIGISRFHLVSHDLGSWIGKALAANWVPRITSYVLAQTSIAVHSYTEVPQFVWVRRFPSFFIKFLEPRRTKDRPQIAQKRVAVTLPDEVIDRAVQEFLPGAVRSWISYHCAIGPVPCILAMDFHLKREFDYFGTYTFPTLLLQGAMDPAQPSYYYDGSAVLTCGHTIWPFSPQFPNGIGCVLNPTEEKDNIWRFSKPLLHQKGDQPATAYFPSAQMVTLPNLGHFANIEDPETYSKIILEFILHGKVSTTQNVKKEDVQNVKIEHDEL